MSIAGKRIESTLLLIAILGAVAIGFLASCGEERAATDDEPVETVEARDSAEESDGEGRAADDDGPTRTWTNDRSRLSGDKLTNFVPFTFEYPADWQVLEDGADQSPNFVKVESMTEDRVTIENFAVGWYAGVSADQVTEILEPQFSQSFPNYQRLSSESHHVDGLLSPGFTFQVTADTPQGRTTFWGRTIAAPVAEDRGIIIVMFASDQAPWVDSAADLGEAGNLESILDSFDVQE